MPDFEVSSAGLDHDADLRLTAEMVAWADIIFVMEKIHRSKLRAAFGPQLKTQHVICLDIPDRFKFMDPDLVRILKQKVPKFIGVNINAIK